MSKYSDLADRLPCLTRMVMAGTKSCGRCDICLAATALRELEAEKARHEDELVRCAHAFAEWVAERDRLREVGKWLAAEARENWDKGRLSVDLMTAVEAWDRTALEGKGDD